MVTITVLIQQTEPLTWRATDYHIRFRNRVTGHPFFNVCLDSVRVEICIVSIYSSRIIIDSKDAFKVVGHFSTAKAVG
ncbi:hypothetical protein SAMN03159428_03270 [Kosakonia radicincitans]|uniref:Uncharacterized protein n=1 Tax=Kosakonia radicincitans TaxID=283686 RepID=A0AAX2EW39_9ENTR|nr:hypothetical protein SAMN03159468_04016 [Kosakonia radicincitans]SFR22334.1 hypothetical protein SAMN03159514_03809 [Kosakonia radicincitans]SFT99223.1 hypothetical protein SAMN03159428_03270 [Kosakonia radicincitans]SFY15057.1 hypothetical protein SAMN03159436_04000 [Kosakonia radicincitans]